MHSHSPLPSPRTAVLSTRGKKNIIKIAIIKKKSTVFTSFWYITSASSVHGPELPLFTQRYGRTCSREPDSPGLEWGIKAHRSEFSLVSFLLAATCKPGGEGGPSVGFLQSAPSCPSPGKMAGSVCPVSSCCF